MFWLVLVAILLVGFLVMLFVLARFLPPAHDYDPSEYTERRLHKQ